MSWYLTRNYNYWSKRGIKGPRPLPFFGNSLQRGLIAFSQVSDVNWLKKYGKLYGSYEGSKPVLNIADPELIKTILVKDFQLFPDRQIQRSLHPISQKNLAAVNGEEWRRIRGVISPTFTSGKMKRMYPLIRECLNDFVDHLEVFAKDRLEINAKDMYGNYTMDVIATCAFATKINSHKQLDNPYVQFARKAFDFRMFRVIAAMLLPKFIQKLIFGTSMAHEDFFYDQIRKIIDNRKRSDKRFNDFLQMALEAQKPSDAKLNAKDKYLTEDEVMAQAFAFLLGGYETTATTLMYITFELALNPDIQDRLYEEVIGSADTKGEISYEELAKMPYLDAILSETLRLHSPAVSVSRVSTSEHYKLANTGLTIDRGTIVRVPTMAMHLKEEYYPEPYRFKPDRFMPENKHKLVPYTYLPFGAGPRNCIGMRFALLAAKLGLVHIVKRFKFFRTDNTDVPLLLKRGILNTPQRLIVGIEKR